MIRTRCRHDETLSNEDFDGDGLNDPAELSKTEIDVVRKNGELWRYDANDETDETVEVTSNPLYADTDRDGASDRVEIKELHTDPNETVTYGITKQHQQSIDELYRK